MAQINEVLLNGMVCTKPIINDIGEYYSAMFSLQTVERINSKQPDEPTLYYATPIVFTANQDFVELIKDFHVGDMVQVLGAISTGKATRATRCPRCEAINPTESEFVYITPIHMERHEIELEESDAKKITLQRAEISNRATIIGNLCNDPIFSEVNDIKRTQFQIAITRTFRPEEEKDEDTDYPWVEAYGNRAEEYSTALHTGSVILIKGHIRTKRVKRQSVCEKCKSPYIWSDVNYTMIAPSFVEYIHNCNFPDGQDPTEE